jgi:hypothetical protein
MSRDSDANKNVEAANAQSWPTEMTERGHLKFFASDGVGICDPQWDRNGFYLFR